MKSSILEDVVAGVVLWMPVSVWGDVRVLSEAKGHPGAGVTRYGH